MADTDSSGGVEFSATSEYAAIENGQLTLEFDRLNDDATTSVDTVFEVTATDKSADKIWIDHDLPGVTFYDDQGTELTRTNPLELDPGESATVGVSIDTHDAPTGTETFSIVVGTEDDDEEEEVSDPGPLEVTNASVEPAAIEVGESVEVTATVSNPNDRAALGVVDLGVDGAVVKDRQLTMQPNENRTVSFTWTPGEAGTYAVSIGGEDAGTVAVSDPDRPTLGSYELASPMTAAVAPPTALGLLVLGSVARRRRL